MLGVSPLALATPPSDEDDEGGNVTAVSNQVGAEAAFSTAGTSALPLGFGFEVGEAPLTR